MKFKMIGLVALLMFVLSAPGFSQVITFDDLNTRNNFFNLGIAGTYQGFQWGIPGQVPQTNQPGWAVATVGDPIEAPPPTPVSGSTYAWNYNGPQSLAINFGSSQDVAGAWFATLSSEFTSNASTVQMFGYGSGGGLVASSGILSLTDSFQYLAAGFSGVYSLELRSNADSTWFAVDDITLGPSDAVPEPGTIGLVALGLLLSAGLLRRARVS
jgi:hypothetical protein